MLCWTFWKIFHIYAIKSQKNQDRAEAYTEHCQRYKIECFAKIVKGWSPLTIFEKPSILDVWQDFIYTSVE